MALKFVAGAGDETFAWYRGPLSPVVPQALPQVGQTGTPVAQATSADALMIYLAEQGVFDMSYAAAWNIGRSLALADAHFAQAINRYVRGARRAAATIAQRLALPHFAGETDSRALLAAECRRRFASAVGSGLGQDGPRRWDGRARAAALIRRHDRGVSVRPAGTRASSGRGRTPPRLSASTCAIRPIRWPTGSRTWRCCTPCRSRIWCPIPAIAAGRFHSLLLRRSRLVDALRAGACSIALHHSGDVAAFRALHPHLAEAVDGRPRRFARPVSRRATGGFGPHHDDRHADPSSLVSSCPALVVTATAKGTPLAFARNDCPSATSACACSPASRHRRTRRALSGPAVRRRRQRDCSAQGLRNSARRSASRSRAVGPGARRLCGVREDYCRSDTGGS